MLMYSAIVRTLNSRYHAEPYGLGNVNTTYPISAFITDLVYLRGTAVEVDVKHITVSTFPRRTPHLSFIRCLTVIGCQMHRSRR
jgi:hypothetical protein